MPGLRVEGGVVSEGGCEVYRGSNGSLLWVCTAAPRLLDQSKFGRKAMIEYDRLKKQKDDIERKAKAKLVRAAVLQERESCAVLAESLVSAEAIQDGHCPACSAMAIAKAIRARK